MSNYDPRPGINAILEKKDEEICRLRRALQEIASVYPRSWTTDKAQAALDYRDITS